LFGRTISNAEHQAIVDAALADTDLIRRSSR
jgi:hypothetical protein